MAFFITKNIINNSLKKAHLQRTRRKIIIKAIQLFTTIGALILVAGVWGLEQNEIAVFASTLLTALGIDLLYSFRVVSTLTIAYLFFSWPKTYLHVV